MRPDYVKKDRISKRAKMIVCASAIAVALGGCSAQSQNHGESGDKQFASKPMSAEQCAANASIQEAATKTDADYRIQPGDTLMLDFYMNSEFNDTTTVDPNGKIVLRMVGPVQAAGLDTGAARHLDRQGLQQRASKSWRGSSSEQDAEPPDLCRGRSHETRRVSAATWNDRGAGAGAGWRSY